MKMRLLAIFLLILTFTFIISSCNGNSPEKPRENQSGDNLQADNPGANENEDGETGKYIFPELDCNQETFTFLNIEPVWNFRTAIVTEELTGDLLDDAIHMRNIAAEDKFNVRFAEVTAAWDTMHTKIKNAIMSGDNVYQVIYCPGYGSVPVGALVAEKYFYDLRTIPELRLDKPWWDQLLNKESSLGTSNSLYFTCSDVSVMALQGSWCLFFNQDMMVNLGLELPYNKVRDGTWTLDEFNKYLKDAAKPNEDGSFKFKSKDAGIIGLASFYSGTAAMIYGAGENYIGRDADNNPQFADKSQRFYDVCEKIAGILGTPGHYVDTVNTSIGMNFTDVFKNNKSMFMAAEIKEANNAKLRGMDETFGILPMPKYDANQKDYCSVQFIQSPVMVIPITNPDTSRAGIIMDALSYMSYNDIGPLYFDVITTNKDLRNDDSVDMLNIIRASRYIDIGVSYGWTYDNVYGQVRDALNTGKSDIASILEASRDKVRANIEKTMSALFD